MSDLQLAIGSVWRRVSNLDWSGWYPLLCDDHGDIVVSGLVEADREDLCYLIPVVVLRNGSIAECDPGDQDGFMDADEYRRVLEAQLAEGGSR